MTEFFEKLFDENGFMPHGMCILWRNDLLFLHVVSDALIALAYFAIPGILLYFLHKRKDVVFSWVFVMFALFIVACGFTHLMGIWTFWYPDYLEQGLIKALTAIISMLTAIALVPILPQIINLPSPKQLLEANKKLNREIEERINAEKRLEEQTETLKTKAEELDKVNNELSSFNEVFTGREQRMVELKQQVNTLLDELGRPKEYSVETD